MRKIQISISKNKYIDVTKVTPNIYYTRFDKIYENFEVLDIEYNKEHKFIPISINGNLCHIASYMVDIDKRLYRAIFYFVYTHFRAYKFHIQHSAVLFKGCKKTQHYLLCCPDTYQEYLAQFTAKSRYNLKRSKKLLYEKYESETKYLDKKDITPDFITDFVAMAQSTKEEMNITAEQLLKYTSGAMVLYANKKMISAVLWNRLDNSDDVACISMAYDKNYAEDGPGKILYYDFISEMISRRAKRIFMGGGDYGYKKNSHAQEKETCNGIVKLNFFAKVLYKIFGLLS